MNKFKKYSISLVLIFSGFIVFGITEPVVNSLIIVREEPVACKSLGSLLMVIGALIAIYNSTSDDDSDNYLGKRSYTY